MTIGLSGIAPVGRDWEATFRSWSRPPSDTEDERCENASRMVRDALWASAALRGHTVEVFAQGSYRNNTNVRAQSDVDICVRYMDVFYADYTHAPGLTGAQLGFVDATYSPATFKADVESALRAHFGWANVERGNKVLVVRENTYRVSADVAPTFERRRYSTAGGRPSYQSGVLLFPDAGGQIENWPQQHYDNGVAKNERTGRRFKALVRIFKRLRDEMAERGYYPPVGTAPPKSLFIESLVCNVPDDRFGHTTFTEDVHRALIYLVVNTGDAGASAEWGEVSERKYLFRGRPDWSREQAFAFVAACWRYVGLG